MHRNLYWTLWNNLVFRILDAQAAFPLSTGEGLAIDREATTREHNRHNHTYDRIQLAMA